ncbi:MAG: hypothetical protein JWM80_1896 [Cyanobacteria bacterium RYN_339]|nr:hypothetical protein [Cyanobacteria bacterium RYN_339]
MTTPLIPPNLLAQPPRLQNSALVKALAPLAKPPQSAPQLPGQPAPKPPGQGIIQLPSLPVQPAAQPGQLDTVEIVPGMPRATKTKPDAQGKFKLNIPMATGASLFHIQPTPENMQAFVTWFQAFDRPGVLGPNEFKPSPQAGVKRDKPSDPARVRQLQTALARRGYPVQASGIWDQPTSSAVVQFKHARGIHDPFKSPDGKWAITPYADEAVTALILT